MSINIKDKVSIVVVTRDNHVLVQHLVESLERHDAGYAYEFTIVDNSSRDKAHLLALDSLSKKYTVLTYENNRVEVSFQKFAKENIDQYRYHMFLHDDTCVNSNNWLKTYIQRLKSNYAEKQIENTEFSNLPIGRVGAIHQPWREYDNMLGMPVQCLFLKDYLSLTQPVVPSMFKFVDPERVMYTNECLRDSGVESVKTFYDMQNSELYQKICATLNKHLHYQDEGIAPKDKYPPGKCWNKITMTTEFMNSVGPLIKGHRSVGLEGDGFMEQIDGFDSPWGHKFIHHYGSPNIKRFLGKYFGTNGDEIHKKIYSKDKVFLMKCDKIIKNYFYQQ